MPEAFQYAVLRVIPSIARGEALNVAVVLHCRRHDFLGVAGELDEARLAALDPNVDLQAVSSHLEAIERIAAGDPAAGPIAQLDRSERFGAIIAPASTMIQPSAVHTGITADPAATLAKLAVELVSAPATGSEPA